MVNGFQSIMIRKNHGHLIPRKCSVMKIVANDYNGREICLTLEAENQAELFQLSSLKKKLLGANCRVVDMEGFSVFLHKEQSSKKSEVNE